MEGRWIALVFSFTNIKKMKKTTIAIALVGLLGLSSCSDTFEPSVDFGDKTYINEYGKLIDAVNNMSNSLGDRLDALNELLRAGLADIKLAIDENTGAIKVQTATLKDGLGTLNTTFLDGFTALNTQLESNNTKLISALDNNGEIIRAQIEGSGKLISTTVEGSTTKLIETLTANNKSLGEKLDAVNTSLSNGLTELTASTNAIGSELKVTNTKLDDMNSNLKNLDTDIQAQTEKIGELSANVLSGFTTLNQTQKDNNDKLVSAIDKNGEVISSQIKTTGEVLSAQMTTSTTEIVKALNDGNATMASKLDAVNTALTTGLANVTAKIDAVDGSIKLQTEAINGVNSSVQKQTEEIGKLTTEVLNGFTGVNSNLGTINSSLGAINTSTKGVQDAISAMNEALGLKLDANTAELTNIVTKINDNTTAISKMSDDMGKQLQDLNKSITEQGGQLVTAIDNQGKVIVEAIDAQGKVLETINTGISTIGNGITTANGKLDNLNNSLGSMNTTLTTINGNIVALDKNMGTLNTNIQTLATKIEEGDKSIVDAIKDLKQYENGIVYDESEKLSDGTYKSIYVTPDAWDAIKDDAAAKNSLKNQIGDKLKATLGKTQYVDAEGVKVNMLNSTFSVHQHSSWICTEDPDDEVVITTTIVKDGITLFKLQRVQPYNIQEVSVQTGCSCPCISGVYVEDATGSRWVFHWTDNKDDDYEKLAVGKKVYNVKVNLYDTATGVFCENPKANVYSCSYGTGKDYDATGK